MLSQAVKEQVKQSAVILQKHGEQLTRHFYRRLFENNPEMKSIFNQGHQASGSQQQALAQAVLAYALQIEKPEVLLPVLSRVAQKHVSLGIRAEHYAIIGKNLLAAIQEVLHLDAESELIAAWAAAYTQLADLMIKLENQLYAETSQRRGGFSGWRSFKITAKTMESSEICSFYLSPAEGGPCPDFLPGQYVSVRVFVPELGYMQSRQYSLSNAPGQPDLRISVKREPGTDTSPAGMVSKRLHDDFQIGDVLDLSAPNGDFYLSEKAQQTPVLISAGVGITPVWSMLEFLLQHRPDQAVHFIHACRNGAVHAFKARLAELRATHSAMHSVVYYEDPLASDLAGRDYDASGRFDPAALDLPADGSYYLCGPKGFLLAQRAALIELGIAASSIHLELFDTGGFAL